MRGISKAFGGVPALKDVELTLRSGEIHALLGENGAGKSTLLKILRGVVVPDAGTIEMEDRAGVSMIFQETSLIPTLSAAQNIFLTREPCGRFGLIDDRASIAEARSLMTAFGLHIDPATQTSKLSAGQLQLVEIVKAISQHSRVLVLDEPTSALAAGEVEHLFALLRRLKAEGTAIVYVSHRMDEIVRIADRASILRDGRLIITSPIGDLTLEQIIEHVIGRESGLPDAPPRHEAQGPPVLELRAVSGARRIRNVDLVVNLGEVVGVAGLLGSGRSALARLLFGMEPLDSGEVLLNGRPVHIANPRDAIAAGMALVPEDRLRHGLIAIHSVADNLWLPLLDRFSCCGWISLPRARRMAEDQVARMRIKTESIDAPVHSLSGGNQQKVALARWLATDPSLLILDEPTAGIDIGSKREIVAQVRSFARKGKAVLLISSELPELLAASDRIVVMANGRIAASVSPQDSSERQLQISIQNANAYAHN